MKALLRWQPINLATTYNSHNAEITLLNQRLQKEYGSRTLSFKRDNIQSNADIDRYVDAVLLTYTEKQMEPRSPVFHLTNPYEEELYNFRREKYERAYFKPDIGAGNSEKIADRAERSKFVQYYNQAEALFQGLEQLKAKHCQQYIPNGVQMYYKHEDKRSVDNTFDHCDLCKVFSSCYKSHTGIGLSPKLVRRMDAQCNWNAMVRAERAVKQLLNKRKPQPVIQRLIDGGDAFSKTVACAILTIILK